MNWRYITTDKKILCAGCGCPERTLDDNRHFSWCQTPTNPQDGPKKTIKVAEAGD